MEKAGVHFPSESAEIEARLLKTFHKGFEEVQTIFNQNTVLICEINCNQKDSGQGALERNIDLIRELNNNMGQVVRLYATISAEFVKTINGDNGFVDGMRAVHSAHKYKSSQAELANGVEKEKSQ
eukprot:c9245_g1_i1 orf=2-373(-)